MPAQGPELCEEYLPYSEKDFGFVVCHGSLPCNKEHASNRDVATRFHKWGLNQGFTEIYFCILAGMPAHAIKEFILKGMDENQAEAFKRIVNGQSDKDKLIALFDEWGVPFGLDEEDDDTIVLEADAWADKGAKVVGYSSFVTHFTFDKDGGFVQIGIWE